jgi:hypothetical protein
VIRLIWAEITRLLSRRFTGIAMIVLLLGLAGYQLVINDALAPPSREQVAAAARARTSKRMRTGSPTTSSTSRNA